MTLDGVAALSITVPVEEAVDDAVEVDADEVGKWLSKAHSSPSNKKKKSSKLLWLISIPKPWTSL